MHIDYSKQAQKFLDKQEKNVVKRIIERVEQLKNNPFQGDVKRLTDTTLFRARVGDYRIIFSLGETIEIVKIEHRSKSYL